MTDEHIGYFSADWVGVDQHADPEYFVRLLSNSRAPALANAARDPRSYFAYLEVEEGQRLLEVGCGIGGVTRILAELVGTGGEVVGLDFSATMIAEATRRATGLDLPLCYVTGDVHALEFADNSFDRALASTVFQHLADPFLSLRELVRVIRPGGRVVITDQDWETQLVDAGDRAITRKIMNVICDNIRHPWIGRQLPGLFADTGLVDIRIAPQTTIVRDLATMREWMLDVALDRAQQTGLISAEEAADWLADLEARDREGRFLRAVTSFRVSGTKPEA